MDFFFKVFKSQTEDKQKNNNASGAGIASDKILHNEEENNVSIPITENQKEHATRIDSTGSNKEISSQRLLQNM